MQTAEKEFRRAIQLDPSYATAHQWYAESLSWQGRFDEALAESERARQLDPLSQIIATDHGSILYFGRRYVPAIAQCRIVLLMDPNFHRARGILIRSYVQSGKFEEAIHEVDAWTNETWTLPWRVFVYGRWGRAAQAEQSLAKFEHLLPQYLGDPDPLLLVAYVGMDRKDQAIALLEKLYAEHSPVIVTLKTDPIFDPLRTDPRFQQLLSRIGSGITPTEHGNP
jgi:tetratricopeptide (TPR) repeat protein